MAGEVYLVHVASVNRLTSQPATTFFLSVLQVRTTLLIICRCSFSAFGMFPAAAVGRPPARPPARPCAQCGSGRLQLRNPVSNHRGRQRRGRGPSAAAVLLRRLALRPLGAVHGSWLERVAGRCRCRYTCTPLHLLLSMRLPLPLAAAPAPACRRHCAITAPSMRLPLPAAAAVPLPLPCRCRCRAAVPAAALAPFAESTIVQALTGPE